ncbi:MAG: helicase-related protein [Akkermansiaceae bacterium]
MLTLLDNITHLLGDDLKRTLTPGAKLKIAASCFSIYAYEALKAELEQVDSVEFIFTSPTFVPNDVADKLRKEHREFHIPKLERERSLYGSEFEVRLRNELTQKAIARECADWMRRKATFRSNKGRAPMQQFACVSGPENATYMPLHGFTAVDLGYEKGNAVSNFVNKFDEQPMTGTWLALFDQIWNDKEKLEDVTGRLCEHIASVYQENSPQRIYFLILYNIFSEFLEDISADVMPNDLTGYEDSLIWQKLFNFQRDAATGIINKLETYNGCILADSVGLGKTFTALAVVKYYELRNRSVLVLCPKKLADNWLNYNRNLVTNLFAKDRFNYDVLCHTDLLRTRGESLGMPLNRVNWGNYDLVVIDESHNFRNNAPGEEERESRYAKLMNQVVRAGVKTKVLMLSATPVNNRFTDLRNQLALAYEGDPDQLQAKLRSEKSIDEIFRRAQATFNAWSALPAEERTATAILNALDFDFFELLDSVTIARSRRHIQTFYDTKDIGNFPERLKPHSHHCQLTQRKDVIGFNEIFSRLSTLTLAVYAPLSYVQPSRLTKYQDLYDPDGEGQTGNLNQSGREKGIQALMTVNLLKRLESSVHSFLLTLQSLETNHRNTLRKIADYQKTGRDATFGDIAPAFADYEPDDDEIPIPDSDTIGAKVQISLSDMDLPRWKAELEADLFIIEGLLDEMRKVTPSDDAKLQHLKTTILSKLASPINPGNKKILLFTAFADTADYLYEHLAPYLLENKGLHSGKVTGSSSPKSTLPKTYDFQSLLTLFSPRSKEKAAILPKETGEIDLLIGTDCISEGQNLQDCDCVINYDIHWNPVRIIQRFGRIDRIGSTNAVIQLVNYWPDITLDEYINLKERVENRMVIADVTATGDDNPLDSKSNDVSYRREQLQRLQDEVIDLEDVKTGISITDLGLNDFRMDLLNYVKLHDDLQQLPNGMHAVVPAAPERELVPGAIFALRNRNDGVNINQQNRLHPYYLVYVTRDGEIHVNHTESKRLLDLARAACKDKDAPIPEAYQPFNKLTKDGRKMDACSALLSTAIRSMIALKEEKDIDSLFTGGKTSALLNTIQGLEDFELIAFLVVTEVKS